MTDPKIASRARDTIRLCCAFLLIILRSQPPGKGMIRFLRDFICCELTYDYLKINNDSLSFIHYENINFLVKYDDFSIFNLYRKTYNY